jgi:hypothetical protein
MAARRNQYDRTQKPTTDGIIRSAAPAKVTPVSDDALWLWGRLRDFERHGLLDQDPRAVLETMTPSMLDDVSCSKKRYAVILRLQPVYTVRAAWSRAGLRESRGRWILGKLTLERLGAGGFLDLTQLL